jgi:hypothetical protein
VRDYSAFRGSAIRYWEWRRLFYNAALVLPALIGYAVTDVVNHVGDGHNSDNARLFVWFVLAAVGANICYTFAYALEFLFGKDEPTSWWFKYGRTLVFCGGLILAILLAFLGGRNIANLDFYHEVNPSGHTAY